MHEPTTWSLHKKTDEELLAIASHQLWRHWTKSKIKFWLQTTFIRSSRRHKRLAKRFYADWYAMEAISELERRRKKDVS